MELACSKLSTSIAPRLVDLLSPTAVEPHDHAHSNRAVPYRNAIDTPVGRSHSHDRAATVQLHERSDAPRQEQPSRRLRRVFPIATDPLQDDRAREIRLCSARRPHMRAFHFAWLSFFIAFFGWFAIPPLLPTIKRELALSQRDVDTSNIAAVASTIVGRVLTGPLCDRYGPRTVQAAVLLLGAIPVAAAALVTNYTAFVLVRFCIGIVGCAFVATTYWTCVMFCSEIVGRANALAAGWGNLGAGVTYLLMPVLFDAITLHTGVSDDMGWRLALVSPALCMVAVGVCLFFYSDDCPQGNFADLKPSLSTNAAAPSVVSDILRSVRLATGRSATWILAFQYACSFGIELMVHNVLSLYYYDDFTRRDCDRATDARACRVLSQTSAGLISSLFGLMCIVARAAGGYASDVANLSRGMRGRIHVHFAAFTAQAVLLYAFSHTTSSLSWSIVCLVAFGFAVQMCAGTTYAIVPYVLPSATGATAGVVGAGGNVGAMVWGFLFRAVGDRAVSFQYLSIVVGIAAAMSLLLSIDLDTSDAEWPSLGSRRPNSQTPPTPAALVDETQSEQIQWRDDAPSANTRTQFTTFA